MSSINKYVISGYGRMGHMIEAALKARGIENVFPTEDVCATDPALAREAVCIDFTTPAAFRENYRWIAENFRAAVVGTTGWYDISSEVFAAFREAGTTLIWGSNFSIGVIAAMAAVDKVAAVLRDKGYEPHIEEVHHIHKLDAPSGTAKTLADVVEGSLGVRPKISSVREGEVPGIHRVDFVSGVDKITIRHEAFSREGLAEGAVTAALMVDEVSGVHEFKDLII